MTQTGSTGQVVMYGTSRGDVREMRVDNATNSIQTIDYAHHEIHAGSHFIYTDSVELGEASQDYLITTPDTTKWAHMMFVLDASAIGQFRLYEGADRDGTTLQTVGNNDRNSSVAAGVTIHKGTSGGTTDGTLINQYKGGSATNQSKGESGSRNDEEIILKQNTRYILRITAFAAETLCNVKLEWYEHTNA